MKDYKKKYEDALERANAKIETYNRLGNASVVKSICEIFPELKESEDERIREMIIHVINITPATIARKYRKEMLDWLEKQGEQKTQGKPALEVWKDMRLEVYQQASGNRHEPNYSDDSTKMFSLTDIDEIFEKVAEKQGEQKPTDKIKPKFKVGDTIRPKGSMAEYTIESISGGCYHGKGWGLLIGCDEDYELVEQKPADKCIGCNNFKGCITCIDGDQYAYIAEQKSINKEDKPEKELAETYLVIFDKKFPILPTLKGKRLADYKNFLNKCQQIFGLKYWGIHPTQAKLFEKLSLLWAAWGAEHLQGLRQTDGDMDNEISMWSEEDEKMLNFLIEVLLGTPSARFIPIKREIIITWLKSFKEKYAWKPSDEQIGTLEQWLRNNRYEGDARYCYPIFDSLHQDLKKLREE